MNHGGFCRTAPATPGLLHILLRRKHMFAPLAAAILLVLCQLVRVTLHILSGQTYLTKGNHVSLGCCAILTVHGLSYIQCIDVVIY